MGSVALGCRASLTWTFTTPAGRTSTLEIDEAGRPVRSQVGDLEPVSYSYDGRGRLASIVQGGGFEQRAVDFSYDGLGRLFRVTDPLLRQVTFAYDATDRVIQQDLPGSRTVLFDWDANGNLISLTPPGQPAHLFDYTPVDLPAIYEPPDAGVGTVATDYEWNLDKNPDTITRPGGAQIVFGYDLGQRPVSITSPRGTQTIQWEPNRGRIQSVTTPEGVSLSYLYDGPLVTRTTWSGGGISGRVDRTYDDDLRLRTVSVSSVGGAHYQYFTLAIRRETIGRPPVRREQPSAISRTLPRFSGARSLPRKSASQPLRRHARRPGVGIVPLEAVREQERVGSNDAGRSENREGRGGVASARLGAIHR